MSTSLWPNNAFNDDGESGLVSVCRAWTHPGRHSFGGLPPPAAVLTTPTTPDGGAHHRFHSHCPHHHPELLHVVTGASPSTHSVSPTSTAAASLHNHSEKLRPDIAPPPPPTHICEFCNPTPSLALLTKMKTPSRIRNFAPSWFSVIMGTGVLPILLLNFPYSSEALFYPALVLYVINFLLFISFTVVSILRYTLYPGVFWLMLNHPSQSLFLGTFPMGFATIVSGSAGLFPAGEAWGRAVEAMWWVDVVFTLVTTVGVCFVMIRTHSHALPTMTAALLLPIVPLVVCGSTGASVAGLQGVNKAVIVACSFLMWSCGLGLALSVIAVYFWRLLSHSLPPSPAIISSFLPVGPLGQGSFAILSLGILIPSSSEPSPFTSSITVASSLPSHSQSHSPALLPEPAATTLRLISLLIALALLGLGTFYFLIALASVIVSFPRRFSVGWWASTFPVGTYALASGAIGKELGSGVLKAVGAATTGLVAVFWAVCVVGTMWRGVWLGEMFLAPCLVEKDDQVGKSAGGAGAGVEARGETGDIGEMGETEEAVELSPCGSVMRRTSRVGEAAGR